MNRVLAVILVVVLSGCASGTQSMAKINPGMNMNDVIEIMGNRDSFKNVQKDGHEYTLFKYTNRHCNAHVSFREKCNFSIIFKNGKVIETDTFFLEGSREQHVTGTSIIFTNPGQ